MDSAPLIWKTILEHPRILKGKKLHERGHVFDLKECFESDENKSHITAKVIQIK